MVRSMIAGVAGLKAHQSKMDVIGNNIANVNTWGFKGYSYNFKDSMYTNSINSTGGNVERGASGGRNASQVGYGSQLSSISNVFESGAPSPSANPMDCMIDGTGFFLVGTMRNGSFTNVADSGLYLSRVGIFRVDDNKYLVDDQRSYVYGYALVDGTGIPEVPAESAKVEMTGVQVDFDDANDSITIAGIEVETKETDLQKAVEDWVDKALATTEGKAAFKGYTIDYNGMTKVQVANSNPPADTDWENRPSFTITSNTTGVATTDAVTGKAATFVMNLQPDPDATPPVTVTMPAAAAMPAGVTVTTTPGVDYEAGIPARYSDELSTLRIPIDQTTGQRYKLDSYSILENGTIVGIDEQNRTIAIGQVALIQVQNPNGLEKTTGYYYTIGDNTGDVEHVKPGTGPTGTIKGSYLEMANVDLANEFSNIITTQRGFQANSKIITVTDEMLQELVNMKR